MKRLIGLALGGMLVLAVLCAPAFANGDIVKVMTQNQYLGLDWSRCCWRRRPRSSSPQRPLRSRRLQPTTSR